jgi:hypothetical protein
MANVELNTIQGVDATWLDKDFVTVTFALSVSQVKEMFEKEHESEVIKTILGEAAFFAIKNAT